MLGLLGALFRLPRLWPGLSGDPQLRPPGQASTAEVGRGLYGASLPLQTCPNASAWRASTPAWHLSHVQERTDKCQERDTEREREGPPCQERQLHSSEPGHGEKPPIHGPFGCSLGLGLAPAAPPARSHWHSATNLAGSESRGRGPSWAMAVLPFVTCEGTSEQPVFCSRPQPRQG